MVWTHEVPHCGDSSDMSPGLFVVSSSTGCATCAQKGLSEI